MDCTHPIRKVALDFLVHCPKMSDQAMSPTQVDSPHLRDRGDIVGVVNLLQNIALSASDLYDFC